MGTPMTLPDTAALARAVPVTPLLAFLAGGHAGAIARIWPAPHEDFLALPAARRHAAAILAGRAEYPPAQVQWLAARARDGDLAAELFGGEAPGGLMKAPPAWAKCCGPRMSMPASYASSARQRRVSSSAT